MSSKKVLFGCGIVLIAGLFGLTLLGGVALAAALPWSSTSQVEISPELEGEPSVSTQDELPADINADVVDLADLQACTPAVTLTPGEAGQVEFYGVSFILDPALANIVQAQACPAVPYNVNDPWAGHPPYIAFTFPNDRPRIMIQPELRVYMVTEDISTYLYPMNSLGELQAAVTQQPQPITWFDGTALHVHRSYLPFASGQGVRGVVEHAQDYFFYINNDLQYEFDGLTRDGAYYVNFHYPIAAPFLMDIEYSDPSTNYNPQAIAIPEWTPDDYEQITKTIQSYNEEALRRFDGMAEADFSPNLSLLDALVNSLVVAP